MPFRTPNEYWQSYGQRILTSHPNEKYVVIFDVKNVGDHRFYTYADDREIKKDFPDFISAEEWQGNPLIIDLDSERQKAVKKVTLENLV